MTESTTSSHNFDFANLFPDGEGLWQHHFVMPEFRRWGERDLGPIICQHCGRPFEAKRAIACYCSPRCRVAAYRIAAHQQRDSIFRDHSTTGQ